MQPIFLLKNSGHTRFDHGAQGAACMTCFSTLAHFAFTAGVSTGAFRNCVISLLIFALLKYA